MAFDLVLRVAATLALLVLALVMARSKRSDAAPKVGVVLCASVMAFVVSSAPGVADAMGVAFYPVTALCVVKPVLFWMFCSALFADRFRVTPVYVAALVVVAALGVWQEWVRDSGSYAAVTLLLEGASLPFIVLAPLALAADARSDLDEKRRRIRSIVFPAVAVYLAAVLVWQAIALVSGLVTPPIFVALNLGVILVTSIAALLGLLDLKRASWLDIPATPPARETLAPGERALLVSLEHRFVAERMYAQEGLTVASLAAQLGTQEHVLRRVINGGLGFRNFNQFLHHHRLNEAAQRLADPGRLGARPLPVLSIALDVGYGSIGPFNRAFKARFGVSPTAYRHGAGESGQIPN